jgi:diguanylate cyclase (GGDEF)-like protein
MNHARQKPSALRSSTVRLMAGFFIVLMLQLAVAGEVWRAQRRVDEAAAADMAAQMASTRVQRAVVALGVTESRLSDYLRTQAVADHHAFDTELANFGGAIAAAAVSAQTGIALEATLDEVRTVLAEIFAANDSSRKISGQLLQVTAALENGIGALAPAASRTEARATLEAALNLATTAATSLAAARSYAASLNPRDADKALGSVAATKEAVTAMLQATSDPPPERLRRIASALVRALDALDTPVNELAKAVARRGDATIRLAAAAANAREAMQTEQNQISEERAWRQAEMADASLIMRRTVLFSAGFATLLGVVLTGLVGLSRYRSTQLEVLATRDPLTGLANRRSASELIDRLWQDRRMAKESIAFIMADIDYFKRLNDSAGHAAGDRCLQRVAAAIEASLRLDIDLVFRYGGEEFLIVLSKIKPDLAFKLAERIRSKVEALGIENPGLTKDDGSKALVTISLGVALARDGATPEMVSKWADDALYDAKRSGRNRVFMSAGQAGHSSNSLATADVQPPRVASLT